MAIINNIAIIIEAYPKISVGISDAAANSVNGAIVNITLATMFLVSTIHSKKQAIAIINIPSQGKPKSLRIWL